MTMPKLKKLSQAAIRRYVREKGVRCPFCHDDDLEPRELSFGEDGVIRQRVRCGKCKRSWTDEFTLKGIVIDYEGVS